MFQYAFLAGAAFFIAKNINNIINFVSGARNHLPVVQEIYRTSSWRTLMDFCVFYARIKATHFFETGLLLKNSSSYSLVYYDGAAKYCVLFPKKRGPCPFSQVTTAISDGKEVDFTEKIREFAGPSHNFHGIPTTPKMFNFENLTFTYRNGTVRTFQKDDVIVLEPLTKPE